MKYKVAGEGGEGEGGSGTVHINSKRVKREQFHKGPTPLPKDVVGLLT